MSALHELKCWPEPFQAMWSGLKRFEVRRDDRGFAVGDRLHLREWDPTELRYTGRELLPEVLYIQTGFGLPAGLVVLGLYFGWERR